MKELSKGIIKQELLSFIATLLLSLAVVFFIRTYLIQPFFVRGNSMEPNFSNGEYLIIDEISYRFSDPKRGEVIVFRFPDDPSQFYIKRIIGLPEETVIVENNEIAIESEDKSRFVLQEPYLSQKTPGSAVRKLKENEFFVLGDNRRESSDSRVWGPLDKDLIIGKVRIRAWPIGRAQAFSF